MSNPCVPRATDFTSSVLHLCLSNLHLYAFSVRVCVDSEYNTCKISQWRGTEFYRQDFWDFTVSNECWWGKFITHSYNSLLPFLVKCVEFNFFWFALPRQEKGLFYYIQTATFWLSNMIYYWSWLILCWILKTNF